MISFLFFVKIIILSDDHNNNPGLDKPNNGNVKGILEDDNGNLWLSTNRGITCFNPETKQFKNYNKSDGLQSDQFNLKGICKLSTGELLFGGTNGYNRFPHFQE